jgi:hypothetical protein
MINLGSKDKNYSGVIKMLDQLLVELEKNYSKATNILENEYQIKHQTIKKEALDMCNLSSGIYNKGIAEGREKGKIDTVKNMLKEGMTLETALRLTALDKATYEKYVAEKN